MTLNIKIYRTSHLLEQSRVQIVDPNVYNRRTRVLFRLLPLSLLVASEPITHKNNLLTVLTLSHPTVPGMLIPIIPYQTERRSYG
jgi:hypothetical protein